MSNMKRKEFNNLLSGLTTLSHNQRKKLLDQLTVNPDIKSLEIVEASIKQKNTCPHCQSSKIQRWGKSNDLQRYRCKACQKTFNSLTETSLSRLRHKEKWLTYSQCLFEGKSIRKSAAICGIDFKTAFRWRHRFLSSPTRKKSKKMVGIVEADETFFTENCKGNRQIQHRTPRKRGTSSKRTRDRVPVLMVRDRNGTEADFVLRQIQKQIIHDHLTPLMDKEVVLCTDGNSIYQSFAQQQKISHKRIIGTDKQYVVDDIFHIQNLNAYISRLKKWMRRFNGVATKYLENYLGWRRIMEVKNKNVTAQYFLKLALAKSNQQLMPTEPYANSYAIK